MATIIFFAVVCHVETLVRLLDLSVIPAEVLDLWLQCRVEGHHTPPDGSAVWRGLTHRLMARA